MEIFDAPGFVYQAVVAFQRSRADDSMQVLTAALHDAVQGNLASDEDHVAQSLVGLRSLVPIVSRNHARHLALDLSQALAKELRDWQANVSTWGAQFTPDFRTSIESAADNCDRLAEQLAVAAYAMDRGQPVAFRSAMVVYEYVKYATNATPDEPVGFIEQGWAHELAAAVLLGLVALATSAASAPDDTRTPNDGIAVAGLELVDSLAGDLERLQATVASAEEMVSLLLELADRDGVPPEVSASARRLSSVLSDLSKSDPPPPRTFNAAMLDAGELLHQHDASTAEMVDGLASADGLPMQLAAERTRQLEAVSDSFLAQEVDDGSGYGPAFEALAALGDSLSPPEAESAQERLGRRVLRSPTGQAAQQGYLDGVEKLVFRVVSIGVPAAAAIGLGWILERRPWLGALIRFVIGIIRTKVGL